MPRWSRCSPEFLPLIDVTTMPSIPLLSHSLLGDIPSGVIFVRQTAAIPQLCLKLASTDPDYISPHLVIIPSQVIAHWGYTDVHCMAVHDMCHIRPVLGHEFREIIFVDADDHVPIDKLLIDGRERSWVRTTMDRKVPNEGERAQVFVSLDNGEMLEAALMDHEPFIAFSTWQIFIGDEEEPIMTVRPGR